MTVKNIRQIKIINLNQIKKTIFQIKYLNKTEGKNKKGNETKQTDYQ